MKVNLPSSPWVLLAVVSAAACSGATSAGVNDSPPLSEAPASGAQHGEASPDATSSPAQSRSSSSETALLKPTSVQALEHTSVPLFEDFSFERILEADVRSIALGHDSRVAVLADVPWVFDGRTWVERPVPKELHPPAKGDRVDLFFGRDNQPRLMGTRVDPDGTTATTYLRLKGGRWRKEPSELGPLASARDGLYGILGFADPEIVCAPKGLCLIKRLSGWARTQADNAGDRFYLTPHGVYATRGSEWLLLEGDEFRSLGHLPFEPLRLCHRGPDEIWAVSAESLWFASEQKASTFKKQGLAAELRDLQCDARDVWVASLEGAFVLRDSTWFRVPDVTDVAVVALAEDRVWLGGTGGLFWGKMP